MPFSDEEVAQGLARLIDERLGGEPQTEWAEARRDRVLAMLIEELGGEPMGETGANARRFAGVFEVVAEARFGITTRDVARKCSITVETAQRHLRLLRDLGWIETDGVVEEIKGPKGVFTGSRQMFTHRVNPAALLKLAGAHLEMLNLAVEARASLQR